MPQKAWRTGAVSNAVPHERRHHPDASPQNLFHLLDVSPTSTSLWRCLCSWPRVSFRFDVSPSIEVQVAHEFRILEIFSQARHSILWDVQPHPLPVVVLASQALWLSTYPKASKLPKSPCLF
jgi:hypothetical protein